MGQTERGFNRMVNSSRQQSRESAPANWLSDVVVPIGHGSHEI